MNLYIGILLFSTLVLTVVCNEAIQENNKVKDIIEEKLNEKILEHLSVITDDEKLKIFDELVLNEKKEDEVTPLVQNYNAKREPLDELELNEEKEDEVTPLVQNYNAKREPLDELELNEVLNELELNDEEEEDDNQIEKKKKRNYFGSWAIPTGANVRVTTTRTKWTPSGMVTRTRTSTGNPGQIKWPPGFPSGNIRWTPAGNGRQTRRRQQYPAPAPVPAPRPSGGSGGSGGSPSAIKASCLAKHNFYRQKHRDTPNLVWDDNLARGAQDYADQLRNTNQFKHWDGLNRAGLGENLAYAENLYTSSTACSANNGAVAQWYNEIKLYNYRYPTFSSETGHFTAVVWKSTTKVGVGIATKGRKVYVVARYSPAGNMMGSFEQNVKPLK